MPRAAEFDDPPRRRLRSLFAPTREHAGCDYTVAVNVAGAL
jgi:hypothetical protein